MKIMLAIFIILSLVMLVGGHAGLWYSIIKLFGITGAMTKKILAIILGLLSISFIIGILLVHWHETPFTSKLYLLSGVWLGTVWYIALAVAVTWFFYWFGKWTGWDLPIGTIAGVFIFVALLYSAYGIVNAFSPQIVSHDISLSGLPEQWRGKKVVQLSDIHLGTIHNKAYMRKIVDKVNSLSPDIVFITGDLFDGTGQHLNHMAQPINNLKVPLGIYYVTGNHETYISLDNSLSAIRETKAVILRDQVVDVNGVQIVGIDYPKPGQQHDISGVLSQIANDKPSIILYHEPKKSIWQQIEKAGGDLMLSGHTHQGQLWPFGGITKLVYGDYHYGLHQARNMYINTSSGVGTWGPPLRTGCNSEIIELTLKS